MFGVAEDLTIRSAPRRIPVDVPLGTCAIALTSWPFKLGPADGNCWAILGDWLPAETPVGMLVTFRAYVPAGRSETVREVGSVFASAAMRGQPNAVGQTIPVAVGRWLFEGGYLTLHSPDRTDVGDRWGQAVGGELPVRNPDSNVEHSASSGQEALDLLNRQTWDPAPWPDLA